MKKISFGLSVSEVDKAIKEIEKYKAELNAKLRLFAERLAQEGIYIARVNIAEHGAIYSSELLSSVNMVFVSASSDSASYTVYTDCPYAKYVEFGFGVVGKGNPSPDASVIGWKYDVNDHGEKGWFYYKEGAWHWSKGQAGKPFMWETGIELRKRVVSIAKEVFK